MMISHICILFQIHGILLKTKRIVHRQFCNSPSVDCFLFILRFLVSIFRWGHSHFLFEAFAEISWIVYSNHVCYLCDGVFSRLYQLDCFVYSYFFNEFYRSKAGKCFQLFEENGSAYRHLFYKIVHDQFAVVYSAFHQFQQLVHEFSVAWGHVRNLRLIIFCLVVRVQTLIQ